MTIKSLNLQNFRNYEKKKFVFPLGTTLVVGPNTSGKTNLLEAIYLIATGKSFRAGLEQEMINYGKQLARVEANIGNSEGTEKLAIMLTTGEVAGQKAAKKKYLLNDVSKRMVDFVGQLRCVLFRPEDLEIVIDSPSIRRNYLDQILVQVDREYRRAHLSYQKGLRQRNKLLEQIRDEGKPHSILFFWNKLLMENGQIITAKREELINFVNLQPAHFGKLKLHYDNSIISPQRLAKYADREVAAGMTLCGPHRDDFVIGITNSESRIRNLHIYGSRGEQRTAVFSLKLAELEFVAQATDENPVLLLDDIFSELDHDRRRQLLKVIPKQQTLITTTDIHLIDPKFRKKVATIELR